MDQREIQSSIFKEDIGAVIDWSICSDRHVLVVHLTGWMDTLETQLDGRTTSLGPPLPNECWLVPAGCAYASAATGGRIRYAEVEFGQMALRHIQPNTKLSAWSDPLVACLAVALAGGDRDAGNALAERIDDILAERKHVDVRPLPPARLNRLLRNIDNQLDGALSLRDLAAQAGCSINAFIKAFVASTGETPAQYIIRQRVRRAQWHLANSDADITHIALNTGFSNHAHLTSTFTRRLGQSPRHWRRSVRAGMAVAP